MRLFAIAMQTFEGSRKDAASHPPESTLDHDTPPHRCKLDEPSEELIEGLRAADPSAIDTLYRAHHAELRAFAQRVVGDHGVAEDLVHDVFMALPAAARRYRGESSFRSFLLGIAANRCGSHVRTARRRRAALARLEREPADVRTGEGARDPAELSVLQRALDRLPLAQRTALVLCEVEERTAAEVAQILAVPEATVRTRCFHARRKLLASLMKVRS